MTVSTPSDLRQLRITDLTNLRLAGPQTTMNVGETLNLKTALFDLNENYQNDIAVRWSLKSISGGITSGLSCGSTESSTCDFSPTQPGTIYVEAVVLNRSAQVIASTDTTHPIVVSAPNTATAMAISAGNNQTGLVGAVLGQTLQVLVTDAFGRPVAGQEISFVRQSGSAVLTSGGPFLTGLNGIALAGVQLGTVVETSVFRASLTANPTVFQDFSMSAFPSAPVALEFVVAPTNTMATLPFSVSPQLAVKDTYGNIVTTSSAAVTVAVSTGSGTLSGSTTKNFTAGLVTYTDLVYSLAENNVILEFSSGGLSLLTLPLNFSTPLGSPSITPDDVDFGFAISQSAGILGRSASTEVTLAGLGTSISVAVTGSGNPTLRLNGGLEQNTLSGVNNGDKVQVLADAPSVHGAVHVVTVALGGRSETFEVRYVDPSSVAYAFVTSTSAAPTVANSAACVSRASAAGYGGSWVAAKATESASLKQVLPWQWGKLKRLDGTNVVTHWNQLWSGSLINPITLTELYTFYSGGVWTGVGNASSGAGLLNNTCNSWSSLSLGVYGRLGLSSSQDGTWINGGSNLECTYNRPVYCISDPNGPQDTTPLALTFDPVVTTTPSDRQSSAVATVRGLTTLVTATVSGASGTPRLKVNGGSEVSSAVVGNGDQIQLVMTGPSVVGQSQLATLAVGSLTVDWSLRLADSAKTAAVFVSSTTSSGNLGGVSGANNTCQSLATAAGYLGTWKAMLTTSGIDVKDNISWNWGNLRRLDGAVVATSWNDLWDGTIANPINITENLTVSNTTVWTGSAIDSCVEFGTVSSSYNSHNGDSSAVTGDWFKRSLGPAGCNGTRAIYCMSDPSGAADVDPNPISIPMVVAYNSGETLDFAEVTVLGVTNPINVSLTGAQGTPALKINGVLDGDNLGSVSMGDKIQVQMTAPTVLGQQYTATLTLGPDIYQIKIGYADNSKTARIFVASAVFSTNVGTLGLDSRCTDAAETAGLGGSWKAVVSTDSEDVINRIPWNWGTLKLVDNATVVASNWSDLWDGTIAHPINSDEYSNANLSYTVATGSTALGKRTIGKTRGNWVAGVYYYGSSSAASGSWMNLAPSYSTDSTDHFYCFEDTSAAPDTLPSILKIPYRVFQETSTLVTSESYDVKGITTAVNVSLADLSPSGIAGAQYSINNSGTWLAAGVSSTVNNGDTIQIRMTSPASLNSSYKATLTVGSSSAIPWRVWTKGVASGTTIKRFFSSNPIMPISIGGMAGADSFCQTSATTQGLGGTWKALLSGEGIDESNWAINRIGYLWTELWTMDGTGAAAVRLLSAPNLWNDSPLESLPNVSVAGALISTTTTVTTNTDKNGFGIYSGTGNCSTWTSGGLSNDFVGQSAGSLSDSQWLHTSGLFVYCNVSQRLYCVEQ